MNSKHKRSRTLKALHSLYSGTCLDRHLTQIDTSHRWRPPADGQLPWSEATPVDGYLEMDISLKWTHPAEKHVPDVDSSQRQKLDQFMIPTTYNVLVNTTSLPYNNHLS